MQEKNLKGYDEYLYVMKYGGDKAELVKLFELVTTNETFFFREPQQFDVLCGDLLKKIMRRKTQGCPPRYQDMVCGLIDRRGTLYDSDAVDGAP